ncbi:hypothetical protein BLOT_002793 [Blomia tropicalis]|nr:hypothetical protein BLOT_002793 [Blomia tropicalis]
MNDLKLKVLGVDDGVVPPVFDVVFAEGVTVEPVRPIFDFGFSSFVPSRSSGTIVADPLDLLLQKQHNPTTMIKIITTAIDPYINPDSKLSLDDVEEL